MTTMGHTLTSAIFVILGLCICTGQPAASWHGAAIPTRQDGFAAVPPVGRGHRRCGNGAAGLRRAGRLQRGLLPAIGAARWTRWAGAALALGLLVRAIGDFGYVGFFKRKGGNPFARLDTRVYSPLCLLLAAGTLAASGHWPMTPPGSATPDRFVIYSAT